MRNENCEDCKLHKGCSSVCLTTTKKHGDLMVIIDIPAESDDKSGSIMGSKKDSMIFEILEKACHADMDNVYKAYAIKCRPAEGVKPGKKELEACQKYLFAEIEAIKPKAIILVGDTPLKMVLGLSGITKERGKVHTADFDFEDGKFAVKCVPIVSPGYISHNYNAPLIKQYAEDIYRAYEISIGVQEEIAQTRLTECKTIADVKQLIEYIKQTGQVSFDYETSEVDDEGLGVFDPDFKVTLISASFQIGSAWTIPMQHEESPFDAEDRAEIWDFWFTEILENPLIDKIAHNAKYELLVSRRFGCIKVRGKLYDTMLMHHLLYEADPHGLKPIVDGIYPQFGGYEDETKQAAAKYGWEKVPMRILSPYGGNDADLTLRLRDRFEALLMQDDRSYRIFRNLTMYAIRALFEAEWHGMPVDRDIIVKNIIRAEELLAEQEKILREYKQVKRFELNRRQIANDAKIALTQEKMLKHKPESVQYAKYVRQISEIKLGLISYYNKDNDDKLNFGSPQQLGDLIYDKDGFGYPMVWDRKKRAETKSTDKKILMQMKDKYGFFEDLKLYRSISKTLSTYLRGVLSRLDTYSRVHTSFLQHGTETGRLSSRNPNLQNLPNMAKLKNEIAKEVIAMVKKAFIPLQDHYIVQVDYKQAELRLVAEFANEVTMLKAYADGKDLHEITGAQFKKMTLQEFQALKDSNPSEYKDGRYNAKAGNFGMIYMISAEGFVDYAKNQYGVDITLSQSEEWIDGFFSLYPNLKIWHQAYIDKAEQFGYVRTLFGRKRHTPEIDNPDSYLRAFDERVAVNSPIQGTAGEFTILAVALLADRIIPTYTNGIPDCVFLNTIHDSVIFSIHKDHMHKYLKIITSTMENLPCVQFFGKGLEKIKMEVDVEASLVCWKDMEPWEN